MSKNITNSDNSRRKGLICIGMIIDNSSFSQDAHENSNDRVIFNTLCLISLQQGYRLVLARKGGDM